MNFENKWKVAEFYTPLTIEEIEIAIINTENKLRKGGLEDDEICELRENLTLFKKLKAETLNYQKARKTMYIN